MKHPPSHLVPVDTTRWSDQNRARLGYLRAPTHYQDKIYRCRVCQQEAVFTAEQQKREYEVKKATLLRQRVLCQTCFQTKAALQVERAELERRWRESKPQMLENRASLIRWIEVLNALAIHGSRRDQAKLNMLAKLVANAA